MFWQMCLENLKELLQLHHQRPIGLDQIVTEVILAGVDALSGDLRKRKREREYNALALSTISISYNLLKYLQHNL